MKKQLSLRARPKTFDEMVGQKQLLTRIRKSIKKNGVPKGWLFCGPKGSGKTSLARIIAVSLQCKHQDRFGNPCMACYRNRANMPIINVNCAKIRGVDDLEKVIARADFSLFGKGRRVFILDEAHRLSGHAQDVLLDPFEDDDNNAVWIICSTRPDKIVDTVRSRLKVRTLRQLTRDDILELVTKLLKRIKSALSADDLTDALVDNGIVSGRLIANAVESYNEGASAEDAADVDSSSVISSKALCRNVVKGDWEETRILLSKADDSSVRALRAAVIGYLRVILKESSDVGIRTQVVADAIKRLAYVGVAEDVNQMGALEAELYGLCVMFAEYTR